MERKAHHRKKDVGKREKEATNIRCKKWKVKESGECAAGGPWAHWFTK